MSTTRLAFRRLRFIAVLALSFSASAPAATTFASETSRYIGTGTTITFRVLTKIASHTSKTGEQFRFVLTRSIPIRNDTIPANGTIGYGTVYLAGRAGSSGHEGNLTLRLDSLRVADGRTVLFNDQRQEINGRNRKTASMLIGLIPYIGLGAGLIHGKNITIDRSTVLTTKLRPRRDYKITPRCDPALRYAATACFINPASAKMPC